MTKDALLLQLRNHLLELRSELARERRGVSTLDSETLLEANRHKGALIEAIEKTQRQIADADSGALEDLGLRREVRNLADEVRLAAQSNALLLNEATVMVKHVLGTGGTTNGYDKQARPCHEPRRAFSKAI